VRRRYHRHRDPADRRRMHQLQEQVKTAIRRHRNDAWKLCLESLETQDNSLWRMAKALKREVTPNEPLHGPQGLVYQEDEKAEVFADSLEAQCSPVTDANTDLDNVDMIHRRLRRRLAVEPDSQLPPASPDEIKQILRRLKKKKAPGPDGIPNLALKLLPQKGVAHLVAIANATLRLRHFPAKWKEADVALLLKAGKSANFPQNFRPISLLPTMGKILEKIILTRLDQEVEALELIQPEQCGFRSQHSTTHQALRVVETITRGFGRRDVTGALFLDISKAFDKVWHQGLLWKMLEAGISLPMVQLVRSFLRRRYFRVKLPSVRSTPRQILAGVPQGSVLAPRLFIIYTSDVPKAAGTTQALYADDTAILASSRNAESVSLRLQAAIDALEDWYTDWRFEVNPEKSTAVLFQRRRLQPGTPLEMYGRRIPWTNQARYLGLTMDERLTWKTHCKMQADKATGAIVKLYPLLARNSKLSMDNKLLLYKVGIRPIMTYASQAWAYAAKTHLKRLQVIQNKALRMAVNAPWFVTNRRIHHDLQIPTILEFLRHTANEFAEKLAVHPNEEFATLWDYDVNDQRRHKRPKLILEDD
jgi:Reverse transcriptase (RNA-dependent DNA polymerase)